MSKPLLPASPNPTTIPACAETAKVLHGLGHDVAKEFQHHATQFSLVELDLRGKKWVDAVGCSWWITIFPRFVENNTHR